MRLVRLHPLHFRIPTLDEGTLSLMELAHLLGREGMGSIVFMKHFGVLDGGRLVAIGLDFPQLDLLNCFLTD